MKKRYSTPIRVTAITVAVLLCTITALPSMVMADRLKGDQGRVKELERTVQLPVETVTIEKKTVEAVITGSGDRFKLSSETIITGLGGQQVSIRKMLVPCEARITYERKKGRRIAQRIKMLAVGNDSKRLLSADKPE